MLSFDFMYLPVPDLTVFAQDPVDGGDRPQVDALVEELGVDGGRGLVSVLLGVHDPADLLALHLGERQLPFTAEGFLRSFSLPNFYFHATTAYDILRTNGVPLGKRDFMGRLKMKA